MKNFSKKLSFVMATAMVVTSLYAPQNAEAATKNAIVVKGSKKAVKSKNIYIGGKTVDFDAIVKGKNVKKGTWKTSNKKVASVDKNGVVKALKNGKVTISFKTKATKKTKSKTVKMTIYARTRASKMTLTPAAVTVKEGASADVAVSYELSKKIKAAGGETTTYKLFAESSDEKVATVSVDGNSKVTVKGVAKSATPVSVTVYAAQVSSLAKAKSVKFKLTQKFDVKVNANFEAKQAGANKIKVMGTDLIASKGAYVIKNANGGLLELKDEIKLNDAKTEAMLETVTSQIPEGKYTLTYNNGDSVEFEIVKAVVKSIALSPSGSAIMSEDGKKAYVYYKVLDQFGNDVTKSPVVNLRVTASDAVVDSRGKLTFTAKDAVKGYQLNWDKISVSIVDINSGVATTALLTVGDKARVVDATYEKIYNISKREIVDSITDADKLVNFKLLFTAKDQYGNDYVVEGAGKQLVVNLLGTTGVTVDSNNVSVVEYKGKQYFAYQLKNIGDTATTKVENASRPGEVTIQAVSVNNGKTVSAKFNVVAASKVDTLKVWEGNDGIFNGKKNELGFAAYDANGKEITSWDSLKALNDKPFTSDKARFYFARKGDGKVALYYDLSGTNKLSGLSGSDSLSVPAIFRTMTDKFTNVTFSVKAQKVPAAITGLKSDVAKGVVAGRDLPLKAKDFKYQDQFGNVMTADEVIAASADYKVDVTVSVSDKDKRAFEFEGDAAKKVSTDGSATKANTIIDTTDKTLVDLKAGVADNNPEANVTVQLKMSDGTTKLGEAKTIKVYAVALNKMNGFDVKVPSLVPSADVKDLNANTNDLAKKGFEVEAVGHYAGEEIKLTAGTDFTVLNANPLEAKNANVPTLENEKTVVRKTAVAKVAIADGNGTTAEKEYTYTNERRVVKSAKVKTSPVTAAFGAGAATGTKWTTYKDSFEVKDQYDVDVVAYAVPNITLSDMETGLTLHEPGKNGTKDVAIKIAGGANTMKKATVKLTFNGSTYVFDQVVTFKTTD